MNYKSQIIAAAFVAALALAPAGMSAAEKKKPEAKPAASTAPTAAATKAPRPIPFHGMVSAVDQKAKTFTIAGKKATRVFKVTDKTVITKGATAATMNDIVANEEVSGSYWKAADNSLEAKTVKIGAMSTGEKKTKKSKESKSEASPTPTPKP
ncbi:MAG: hypothetical protein ABI925_04910 [Verrucomicrobiota bacterium]